MFQLLLHDKGKIEYHINLKNYKQKLQAYRDNTQKHILSVIDDYLHSKWQHVVLHMDSYSARRPRGNYQTNNRRPQ